MAKARVFTQNRQSCNTSRRATLAGARAAEAFAFVEACGNPAFPRLRAGGCGAGLPVGLASEGTLAPRIASLAPLAMRNLTTVLAATLTFWRVWGLKPMRAARFCLTSLPK